MTLAFNLFTLEGPSARQENLHAFHALLRSYAPILKSYPHLFNLTVANGAVAIKIRLFSQNRRSDLQYTRTPEE